MIRRLIDPVRRGAEPRAEVPPDSRIYAVGDIHGRVDLLERLHALIVADARSSSAPRKRIVYLGDYVDRGMQSRQVVDLLLEGPLEGFEAIHLKGNHEEFLLRFFEDEMIGPGWFINGGEATLYSYGVRAPDLGAHSGRLGHMHRQFRENLPAAHLRFFRDLKRLHIEGGYLFVHAGIRPGIAPEAQRDDDILWIREVFLDDKRDHGKIVVHGHTINREPQVRHNRIGIDTGAYASGVLTALALEGSNRKFLQTSD
ncbi:MAG TPA: metallophosphoesterase family protein [Alphaproteobacteria bacterium]|nr:metallophosphoesterase family protein [Alphaproteobacteria bacterium]